MFKYVIKRDGRKVEHDPSKITDAIYKAAESVGGSDYEMAKQLTDKVHEYLSTKFTDDDTPTIEEIQDGVEKVLIDNGHAITAKAYILYRNRRTKERNMKTNLMETIHELTYADSIDSDIKRENANINTDTAMGTMLKYGSSTSKEFYEMNILDEEASMAHKNGDIHIHDLDFYTLTETCCQIDLTKLFTNGFSTGHGSIREPNDIATYAALACIAIQSNQNDQHK